MPVKRLSCCRGVDRGNRCSIGRVLVGHFQGRRNGVTEDGRHACGRRFLGVTDKQSREKRPRHISFLAHERPSIEEDRAKKSNFQAIEAARLIRLEFARFSWDIGERLERTDCLHFRYVTSYRRLGGRGCSRKKIARKREIWGDCYIKVDFKKTKCYDVTRHDNGMTMKVLNMK